MRTQNGSSNNRIKSTVNNKTMITHANDSINAMQFQNENGLVYEEQTGLTKREYFASLNFAKIIDTYADVDTAAVKAVRGADALIEQLNKQG